MKVLLTVVVALFLCLFSIYSSTSFSAQTQTTGSVGDALSSDSTRGFLRADKPRIFTFPKDEGAHPKYQTEWWYYTGNLVTKKNRRFGFQFTIFRRAILPQKQQRKSPWVSNQIYFAHFAVSDISGKRFLHSERFSRGAMGLAGTQKNPTKIWIENWFIENSKQTHVVARTKEYSIDLKMTSLKEPVLNGKKGLSQKSSGKGNASYYYSVTRLQTQGAITLGNEKYEVTGLSWLDREWSTSVLGKEQIGWDWFSIQLNDSREIMLYQLRLKDNKIDPHSSGTFIFADGKYQPLKHGDFSITVLDHWLSPKSNIRYPARWKIEIPKYNLNLEIKPYLANQELLLNFAYWEGAVSVKGKGISGNGYVEMTGYD
ncbi:lipocalin-like domain-containing protein [Candidatus Uabimicrobium sp. HlEnr_7]|uniref:lipocalin-like domain-containing protein n=1 Tax=Candidatus Uabimicrobium helgolandensis TaxID=3095367 RepID=UPI00355886C8